MATETGNGGNLGYITVRASDGVAGVCPFRGNVCEIFTCLGTSDDMVMCGRLAMMGWAVRKDTANVRPAMGYDGHQTA